MLRALFGGTLLLFGFLLSGRHDPLEILGNILILLSIGINGLPIIWGAAKELIGKHCLC